MLKKLQLQLLTLGFWLMAMISGTAQTFPVTINTQITQPSPIYLSNYADATTINSPIKVQIALNDLTISNRQIRLKFYFQGSSISFMTNDFVVGARDLYLEGGVPLQLTNVDLAPYFEYQNLVGLNPNQYAQALPEGIYTFSVEVYDFATNKKLSKKTSVTTIIFQNDPPFLNLPLNNTSIMQQNIQNIIFSWTPRQINVSNVEYEFSLVEIWDQYTPVQNAFAYSPPLYTTTTRSTTLQYGISEPQLLPGKKYAWRVKAKALMNAEEVGVFKNNGYSEIFSFNYDAYCTAPLAITTTDISQDQAKVTWSGDIDNFDYQVNYREKNADSEWYKLVTPREFALISNLKPNTTYEYTVGASCEVGKYTHSTIQEFTTLAKDEIAFVGCGIKPDPADLANKNPLPNLYPNDVVKAGDFPIVVLHSSGSNGSFTGDGYVTLPFLEKLRTLIDAANALGGDKIDIGKFSRIRITFKNIGVNTDFKLISGEVIASYDATWNNMLDADKILTDILGSDGKPVEGKLDYVVQSVELNADGSTTIHGTNGAVTNLPKSSYDQVYTDKNGTTVNIPANGSGAPTTSSAAPGGKAVASNTNGTSSNGEVTQISSADVKVTFKDNGINRIYAFDSYPENGSDKLKSSYETIPSVDKSVYKVNYKAVSDLIKGPDVIYANAVFSNGKKKSDIVFKTSSGGAVVSEWTSDTEAKITLNKTLSFAKESIIATVKGTPVKSAQDSTKTVEGKSDIAGKINIWQLTKKPAISVTLLSLNGAAIPKDSDAKEFLNKVYNKVGVEFTVTSKSLNNFSLPSEIECGDSDAISVYSNDQKNIISQVESNSDFVYNEETYYVIYTGKKGSNGYDGFMPLGGQYAFVFDNTLKTASHELGHGIFGLKHPFATLADSRKTDLLMDYGSGTVLSHNDWDIIHSGGWKFYGFQKSSSGGQIATSFNYLMPNNVPFKFNTNDGKKDDDIILVEHEKNGGFSNGTLYNFRINGIEYKFDTTKTPQGFYEKNSSVPYTNAYKQTTDSKSIYRLLIQDEKNNCNYYLVERKNIKLNAPDLTIFKNENPIIVCNDINGIKINGNNEGATNSSAFYDAYKNNKEIDLNELKIVSDLISKFGDKFYTAYFKPTESQPITNNNLIALKSSLLHQIELEESIFGKVSFENFEKILAFLEKCKDNYSSQEEGYIPRCLWDNDFNIPYIQDPAITAGFADGLIETVVGAYDLINFVNCFKPLEFRAWTPECAETRDKTYKIVKIAYSTFTNFEQFSTAASGVWTSIKDYTVETASVSNQARYNQGKIIFNVASLFIGVGEAKAILNGEKTLIAVIKESVAAYRQLPKSLAQLISRAGSSLKTKAIKGVSELALIYQLNATEIKLGTIINQSGKAIVKIEVPMTKGVVLETIQDCVYLNADNVVTTGTVEIVEDAGQVGIRTSPEVTRVIRTIEEIAPNGIIPPNSQNNNLFHEWFDNLLPEELDLVLSNPSLKATLDRRIRWPTGYHEWCMVCEITTFKEWEVPMSEIHRFRTKTLDLTGVNPITGERFVHGGSGSGTFHRELRTIIQQSNSLTDFNTRLIELIERWQVDPTLLPPLIN